MQIKLTADAFQRALQGCGWQSGESILIAVSGGIDSVALMHLFHQLGCSFALAHVNYGLRGTESVVDADFVADLAKKYNVPFFLREVETHELTGNIQASARRIRYAFFEETTRQQGISWIATAHHLDDVLETVLLNMTRGTGINGLKGIERKNGKLIRPLLDFTRDSVVYYAQSYALSWREDSSNATYKYTRNRIRHQLIPELMRENAQYYGGFQHTIRQIKDTAILLTERIEEYRKEYTCTTPEGFCIDLSKLEKHQALTGILYGLLEPYGFTLAEITQLQHLSQTGRFVESADYRATRDRSALWITPLKSTAQKCWQIERATKLSFLDIESIDKPANTTTDNWTALLDEYNLQWPLELRTWLPGDAFQPFGMQGRKNISDVLTDLKWPSHQRQRAVVLTSAGRIIWVPGYRIADEVRITSATRSVILLRFDNQKYIAS
jgi:tRNA(Ile)-lysidine synthase